MSLQKLENIESICPWCGMEGYDGVNCSGCGYFESANNDTWYTNNLSLPPILELVHNRKESVEQNLSSKSEVKKYKYEALGFTSYKVELNDEGLIKCIYFTNSSGKQFRTYISYSISRKKVDDTGRGGSCYYTTEIKDLETSGTQPKSSVGYREKISKIGGIYIGDDKKCFPLKGLKIFIEGLLQNYYGK